MRFQAHRGNELTASGTADQAVYRRDTGGVTASGVRVAAPRPGMPELGVAAASVSGDLASRSWTASGGVVLTRGDATARTASARYAASDGLVRGDEAVEVTGPGYRLTGPSFVADPASGDVDVRGGVRLVAQGVRP